MLIPFMRRAPLRARVRRSRLRGSTAAPPIPSKRREMIQPEKVPVKTPMSAAAHINAVAPTKPRSLPSRMPSKLAGI